MVPGDRSHYGRARYVTVYLPSCPSFGRLTTLPLIVGTFVHDLLFYTGVDSILNRPYVLLPPSIVYCP